MKAVAMVLLLALLAAFECPALEPGMYLKGAKAEELHKALDSADREIEVHENDQFSIGVRRAGDELTFSLGELDTFLEEEKHKDCLVLSMANKGMAPDAEEKPEERKQFADKLVKSFSKYGYRRILIVQWTNGGAVELITDVTPEPPKPAPADPK